MTIQIALLRAVNLGSHNKVGMTALRELVAEIGFPGARTLLQSGNLVFEAGIHAGIRLEGALEQAAKERLGLETDFFVRSASEWQAILAANPFGEEAKRAPNHLVVMLLKSAPSRKQVAALEGAITGRELVHAKSRQVYLVYPDGIGRSKLTAALIERKLGTRATGRNWNTALKLAALAKT